MAYHILSTRSVLLNAKQKNILHKYHIHWSALDFIKIIPNPTPHTFCIIEKILSEPNPALIIASQNSVQALCTLLKKNNYYFKATIYCIGSKTYALAQKLFLNSTPIYLADNAITAIPKLVQVRPSSLFLMQSSRSLPTLSDALHQYKIPFTQCTLYHTILCPHKITQAYDTVLFYSPSGVASFFEGNPTYIPTLPYFCIGETTVTTLRTYAPTAIVRSPTFASKSQLLQTLIHYFTYEQSS